MTTFRSRRASVLGALVWSLVAACSSVPEVVFVDPEGAASRDGGTDAESPNDAEPLDATVSSDAGCPLSAHDDVCCGTSVCSDKDCGRNGIRCSACAITCGGRRCCERPAGIGLECVDANQKCKL